MIETGVYFQIESKHSGRVLDVCQDTEEKGLLIIYDSYGSPNQTFMLTQNGQMMCKNSNKFLTIAANSPKNGAPVIQDSNAGLQGQKFRIDQISHKQCVIYTFCGKVLDCYESGKSNGTKIIQWDYNGGNNQKWILKRV